MSLYPPPSYAAMIWAVGNELRVGLPSTIPEGRGSTLTFPMSHKGLLALAKVLRDREMAGANTPIGAKGTPVQYDIEKISKFLAEREAMPQATLEDLI